MNCPNCKSEGIVKNGFRINEKQNYRCLNCDRQFLENPENRKR